jgi:hypothetical protein
LTELEIIEKSINRLYFLKDFAEIPLTLLLHFMLTVYVYKIGIVGVESNWVHSALRPPKGLLCQPQVIMATENLVE